MPSISSSTRAIARGLAAGMRGLDLNRGLGSLCGRQRFYGVRCLSTLTRVGRIDGGKGIASFVGDLRRKNQTRCFFSCGDGEKGNELSNTYEERRVIGYSPEQLFSVVEAVDLYEQFVPWCQKSKIIKYNTDGSFDAELEIGFKFLVESYVSHVELKKPNYIKSTSSESGLFDHLIHIWEFNPGPTPGTCDLYFFVDFKFQSPLYRQVASVFFKEVTSRLVGSFSDRCGSIYGPTAQALENTYRQPR